MGLFCDENTHNLHIRNDKSRYIASMLSGILNGMLRFKSADARVWPAVIREEGRSLNEHEAK
ncbi:hypothetical protein [Citrobacter sp. JGM124]|uniref:hypothetical protein n=1 Tax=Citrobacter sp. JGM124 TaxID=2799789 RepID=UPI001BAB4612|nr:hypothetical protein [Citrobacter sp. JGM124]MBS0849112.1 hypothetical protein [Citrobacter sp. JGM124]